MKNGQLHLEVLVLINTPQDTQAQVATVSERK